MNKDELIDAIVQIEWPMFAGVNNEGGKATCQMDLATFRIAHQPVLRLGRGTVAWPIQGCPKSGRNLMTEKYARMMKTAFPMNTRL
ncbi:MAG: DUF4125 family protein [Bilophila wadsworthia]